MATAIISVGLVLIVGLIVRKMIRDKLRGKGTCACGGDCSKCKGCH